jgi:hypothetical protein
MTDSLPNTAPMMIPMRAWSLVSLSFIGKSKGTIHAIKPQSGYEFLDMNSFILPNDRSMCTPLAYSTSFRKNCSWTFANAWTFPMNVTMNAGCRLRWIPRFNLIFEHMVLPSMGVWLAAVAVHNRNKKISRAITSYCAKRQEPLTSESSRTWYPIVTLVSFASFTKMVTPTIDTTTNTATTLTVKMK